MRSGLLRICSVPASLWTAAGNPHLFSLVRELVPLEIGVSEACQHVAQRLGERVVPSTFISQVDRGEILAGRRQLHRARVPDSPLLGRLKAIAETADAGDVVGELEELEARVQQRDAIALEYEQLLGTESERQVRQAASAMTNPDLARVIAFRNPDLPPLMAAATERGDVRAARHYANYVWEIVERSALRPTPRDWHVRIAPLMIGRHPHGPLLGEAVTAVATPNFHERRERLRGTSIAGTTFISLNPLSWIEGSRVQFAAASATEAGQIEMVEVAMTRDLEAFISAIGAGAIRFDALRASLARSNGDIPDELVEPLLKHLTGLGVVELAMPVRSRRLRDTTPTPGARRRPARPAPFRFVDVSQSIEGDLDERLATEVQRSFEVAVRVMAAMEADAVASRPQRRASSHEPRPLLEVIKERLLAQADPAAHRHAPSGWPKPAAAGSSYSQLVQRIGDLAAQRPATIEISSALLDELGVPPIGLAWPVDCLVRLAAPDASFVAVLDDVRPAGSLDARFARFLFAAGQPAPHLRWYRTFVAEMERLAGVRLVEILVPPASSGAANAVQRPRLTRWRTGDPDAHGYLIGSSQRTFVPLRDIALERRDSVVIARARGQRLWPVYHATRVPIGPWLSVAETLLEASPAPVRGGRRDLRHAIDAFDARNLPAVIAAGGLVLSPAEWRVSFLPWTKGDVLASRVRAMSALRLDLSLPRYVMASVLGARPIPCDLESVRTIAVLERLAASGPELILEAMMPSPDELWLKDHRQERHASSTMLRLPGDLDPIAAAAAMLPALALWL